jgi:matrixin
MTRTYRRAILIVATSLAVVALAIPAWATNFTGGNGQTGCSNGSPVNAADGNPHAFYYLDVTSNVRSAVEWVRVNAVEPTDVNTVVETSVNYRTDNVIYDAYYSTFCGFDWTQVIGLTTCVSLASNNRCEKHEVRFDLNDMDGFTAFQRQTIACHEIGHTLGLTHRTETDGCMTNPANFASRVYSSHDKAHINGFW